MKQSEPIIQSVSQQ